MASKEVIQLGDPRLRGIAERVNEPLSAEIASLIEDLRDTLANSRASTGYGRGIAAPQLGILQRVIFLQLPGKTARSRCATKTRTENFTR